MHLQLLPPWKKERDKGGGKKNSRRLSEQVLGKQKKKAGRRGVRIKVKTAQRQEKRRWGETQQMERPKQGAGENLLGRLLRENGPS